MQNLAGNSQVNISIFFLVISVVNMTKSLIIIFACFRMDNIEKNCGYFIVEFDECTKDNLPVIDLVPRSWVLSTSDGLRCQYPNVSDSKLKKWVKNQKEPCPDWEDYTVIRIVMEARK